MFGFGHTGSMTFPMTYDYDSDGSYSSRRNGWKNLSSLEKSLSVALGLVSTLAIALMIAVIIVGVKLNEDDYKPSTKPTEATKYPPWVTTISTLAPITGEPTQEVTTRERPTSQPPTTTSLYNLETCVSTECFRAAGDIRMSLDSSVNPCTNFYEFSCGGWIKNHPIPDSKTGFNQFDRIEDRLNLEIKRILESNSRDTDSEEILMAKQFYETCLSQDDDVKDHDMIRQLIDEVMTDSENRTLGTLLAKIRKELGGNYIFNLQIDTDLDNNEINAVYLDHLEFGLSPVHLQANSESEAHLSAYKRMIMNFWSIIYPDINADTPRHIHLVAENIINFERNLSEISSNSQAEPNEVKIFSENTFEFNEIEISQGEIWRTFVDEVMKEIIYSNCTDLDCQAVETPNVILMDVKYFEQIDELLNNTESSIIENYLKWRIILDFVEEASDELRLLFSLYEQNIRDTKYTASRWENCVEKANYFFGPTIATIYVQEEVKDPESFKYKLNKLSENLIEAFYEIIQEVSWITVETQDLVLERLEKLQILVGFQNFSENENVTLFEKDNLLNLTNSSSHFQNVLDLVKWRSEKDLKTILMTSEETILMRDAEIQTTIGSLYSSLSNSIYFPFGILDAPVYRDFENDTIALNYGSMGMLVARMFIEDFEDTATSYINGTLIGMWDLQTVDGFENATNCLKEQYGSYKVSELQSKISINGENTVKMNTADLGGLGIALRAYTKQKEPFQEKLLPGLDYTPDQLFFLSFAQTWCAAYTPEKLSREVATGSQTPAPYRVRGVLENTEEFQQVWNCPLEEDKGLCRVW